MSFKPKGKAPMFEADWFCTCGLVKSIKVPIALVESLTGAYYRCHACGQRWIVRSDGATPVDGEPVICFDCQQGQHERCIQRNSNRDRGDCDCQHRRKPRIIELANPGDHPLGILPGHQSGYVNGDDTNAGT